MTWTYKEATFIGNAANPQPGASVTVVLESDEENAQTREFTWGYDGSMSKAQFVAMVKQEVRAHLQHLNGGAEPADASNTFNPA